VFDQFIHNKVIAHRGAWKNTGVTENSVASLKHAIAMGCEGSEFDVHLSSDSIPFIHHDPEVQGVSIAKTPASQLREIKLSNGEGLPTLESYLRAGMDQNKTKLILEIKASELGKENSIALTNKVVELVEQLGAQAWVDYISFDYDVCREVMKIAPYAKVAYLEGDKAPEELVKDHFYGLDYHFSVLQKHPDWIKDARQRKLTVNVWTVNDQPTMEWLLKEQADFITTNEPELLLKLVSGEVGEVQPRIKVTLLGTGAPVPSIERFGPSILVEAGEQKLLFDCGRGAGQRLWQLKIPLGQINALFLTHLHSDHVVGIPDVWLTGWIPAAYGRRSNPFLVFGPNGTKDMMENLVKAFSWDINTRSKEQNKTYSGALVNPADIKEGFIWEKNGVKVTPFTVRHSEFIDSALGYRIDYAGYSVILSGDTRYSENLVRYAKGADVVIHEVAAANEHSMQTSPLINQILGFHTSPEDAGKVFEQIKPKLAVFSHIVLLTADPSIPPPTINDLTNRTLKIYKGALQVGEDLLSIEIGNKVIVSKNQVTGH
jgi:ribonuclease BN (tRNA processing enzyme)/glycerophosphoryl diester phosphodiesterase